MAASNDAGNIVAMSPRPTVTGLIATKFPASSSGRFAAAAVAPRRTPHTRTYLHGRAR